MMMMMMMMRIIAGRESVRSLDWLLIICFCRLLLRSIMDQVALYESQEPDVDISNDAHDDQRSEDDVGSQIYEAVELPESVFKVVSNALAPLEIEAESDAETVLQVSDEEPEGAGGLHAPDVAVDNLPARIYAPVFRGRLIPDGPPPKSTRGWSIEELKAVIKRCDLERFGSWRQGGQQDRKVFEGNDVLINIHIRGTRSASTVWVQGKRANEVNTRLLAARGA